MCLRCSPGLFRHACGVASCHTSSMAAKPHLGLTKNSSPTTLANKRRAAQNRGVQGAAPLVSRRSGRNPLSSQSAIRRWRNPAAMPQGRRPHPTAGGGRRPFWYPHVGRGILDAPTPHSIRGRQGCRPLRRCWSAVRCSGGTHRSRPTFHTGSPSRNVGDDAHIVPAVPSTIFPCMAAQSYPVPAAGASPRPTGWNPSVLTTGQHSPAFFDKIQKKIECFSNLRCTIDDRS